MQYVHLLSIADTSMKHTISLQSTPILKSCICLHCRYCLSYERELIVRSFLQDFSKRKGSSLQLSNYVAHTAFLLSTAAQCILHFVRWSGSSKPFDKNDKDKVSNDWNKLKFDSLRSNVFHLKINHNQNINSTFNFSEHVGTFKVSLTKKMNRRHRI